ncbi:MAG: CpaF family protein [Lachnospiraceae bacterium]
MLITENKLDRDVENQYLEIKQAVRVRLQEQLETEEEGLNELLEEVLCEYDKGNRISLHHRRIFKKELFDSLKKLGILQPLLEDEEITEILVNGTKSIFYEKGGTLHESERRFQNTEELLDLTQKICSYGNRVVNESSPIVDTRLPDGSRVNIVLPPASVDGVSISIRKFPKEPLTMKELIAKNAISDEISQMLDKLVAAGYNIFVSGSTGSGKTTFLNALSAYIPKNERVITIEDSAELQLHGIKNLIRLEVRFANFSTVTPITIRDLVRATLRMRPDRIIIGECRAGETADFLQCLINGHKGGMGTGHANSPEDMIKRLETMCLMSEMELPLSAIRGQIASGIDLFIHLGRLRDKSRKVLSVKEVAGIQEGEVRLHTLFEFRETGEKHGRIQGQWAKCGELQNKEKWNLAGF